MASLGLPGMSGFVSEFMAFLGLFKEMPWLAALERLGLSMTAVYYASCGAWGLRMGNQIGTGPVL